ncbi:MAG: hypothetical protein H7A51_03510 [Akkermansiaceae bacterium]|nr:hypothetical protein [Akkermansiaceae bacterium]
MKKLLVPALALLAIFLAPSAEATTTEAKGRALKIAQALKKQGISFRNDYWHGLLRKGGSTTIKTTLKAGTEYVLVGGGCSDAYDVDIILYDENMNEVGRDTKVDAVPVVRVKPKWSGTFYIKMQMSNSTYNGAHYALIIGYK